MAKTLVVILGPTGSGKTAVSITLAARFGAPILSTDSRQFYRGMAVGTAQPDAAQLAAAPHHMIANHEVAEHYTCGDYERDALALLDELFREHDLVLAVGGSGLYIDALCEGLDDLPEADPALREELERTWKEEPQKLLAQLQALDPGYYERVDRANPKRVVRALEVCLKSGAPYSTLRRGKPQQRDFNILKIGITLPREELYARIDRRVDEMMAAGLEAEARTLYPLRHLNALQTVGYREMFDYFDGTITRDQAVELIKRNSRRYAKRQTTWFGRDAQVHWFAPGQTDTMIALIGGICD